MFTFTNVPNLSSVFQEWRKSWKARCVPKFALVQNLHLPGPAMSGFA
jgi:hypothetical protein